ncbi:MAG: helix-turn-helix domain-containing protein [Calditrichia bacterium]|nr:helix-turn-helix domain-containing protein [Calditrichota bacterium]MCB0268065.1 helix-turn-helix domain-containing protein [Calditrichota bacterium]MCB9067169.1 helix-turn-helix domain-containing protein [Calditrichia bacterium]
MAKNVTNVSHLPKGRLLSVIEAAEYLSISRSQIYNLMHKEEIRPVKIGRRVLFDRLDLDNYINGLKAA